MSASSSTSSSEPAAAARRYVLAVLMGAGAPLATMAGWNALADPYAVLGGDATVKPGLERHQRLYKAHRLAAVEAELLILGSSRFYQGIDPGSPALEGHGPAYNAALNGASIYELRRYAEHGVVLTGASRLLIGLDFYTFHVPAERHPAFREERLAIGPDGRWQPWFRQADLGRILLTWDATLDSWPAWRCRGRRVSGDEARRRRTGMGSPKGEEHYLRQRGQYYAFRGKELGYMLTRGTAFFAARQGPPTSEEAWQDLARLLDVVGERRLTADLVLPPIHARLQEVIHAIAADLDETERPWGLAPWKRRLVATVAAARRRHPDLRVRLWDFCTYNPYSIEAVPRPPCRHFCGDYLLAKYGAFLDPLGPAPRVRPPPMRHYWEPSHFKPHVGDALLTRVYARAGPPDGDPAAPFGVALDADNLDRHLRVQAERRRRYLDERPRAAAEVAADWELIKDPTGDPQRLLGLRQLWNQLIDPRYREE